MVIYMCMIVVIKYMNIHINFYATRTDTNFQELIGG